MDSQTQQQQSDEAHVTYTVRELLERISKDQATGFARVEVIMAGKADKQDVARLEARLDHHAERLDGQDRRLNMVEVKQHEEHVVSSAVTKEKNKKRSLRRRLIAAVGGVLMLLATAFSGYIGIHLHL